MAIVIGLEGSTDVGDPSRPIFIHPPMRGLFLSHRIYCKPLAASHRGGMEEENGTLRRFELSSQWSNMSGSSSICWTACKHMIVYVCASYVRRKRPYYRMQSFTLAITYWTCLNLAPWGKVKESWAQSMQFPTCKSRMDMWNEVEAHVICNEAMKMIKLVWNGLQAFHSKTKGGADGVTKFRSVLRSPTSRPDWEHKVFI